MTISHYLETSHCFSIRCQAGNSAIVNYDLQPFLLTTAFHTSYFDNIIANLNCVRLVNVRILINTINCILFSTLPHLVQTKLIIVVCVAHSMLIECGLEHVAIGIAGIAILAPIIDAHWECSLRPRPTTPVNHMGLGHLFYLVLLMQWYIKVNVSPTGCIESLISLVRSSLKFRFPSAHLGLGAFFCA